MSQRISDEQLRELAKGMAEDPRYAAFVGSKVVIALILDLDDARARIAELERLSASQATALDLMEAGKL